MKCLSIKQPWATLIATNQKKIETRSWKTNYRGEIYIHASKTWDQTLKEKEPYRNWIKGISIPTGMIIAKAQLVDCVPMTPDFIEKVRQNPIEYAAGDYQEGRYGWILEDIEPLKNPIPAKGMLTIWNYESNEN